MFLDHTVKIFMIMNVSLCLFSINLFKNKIKCEMLDFDNVKILRNPCYLKHLISKDFSMSGFLRFYQ